MYKDLLPIGSVVLLKGGNTRLMIIGRVQTRTGDNTIYDYSACFYPDGIVDSNLTFFNRDAIERVYFIGFQDIVELQFREEFLGSLGELYVNDEGQIVEREQEEVQAAETASESHAAESDEAEAPVFADVD